MKVAKADTSAWCAASFFCERPSRICGAARRWSNFCLNGFVPRNASRRLSSGAHSRDPLAMQSLTQNSANGTGFSSETRHARPKARSASSR
jgi:hypothetical protein